MRHGEAEIRIDVKHFNLGFEAAAVCSASERRNTEEVDRM